MHRYVCGAWQSDIVYVQYGMTVWNFEYYKKKNAPVTKQDDVNSRSSLCYIDEI